MSGKSMKHRLMLGAAIAMIFCSFGVSIIAVADDAPIDSILADAHHASGIEPTPTCGDLAFLRRISLDLIGRVPTNDEIAQFETYRDRVLAIDRLLSSDEFSRYWSQLWTTILVGRGQAGATNREALRLWLEDQIRSERALDQIAFDLISAEGVTALDGHVNFIVGNREDPVTPVSRIFLGVQLDCARCHDHPFDRWTQDDYLAMRKFFQPIQLREVSGGVRLTDSGSGNVDAEDAPRFLTGSRPRTAAWRRELALMTVRCKPFARAMGNRVWQMLMGRGVVDPVDGLSETQTPSVPDLHQALADQLRRQRFDLRRLIRTICSSDAYARTELAIKDASYDLAVERFAARRPRPLIPEQLIASYSMITRQQVPAPAELNGLAGEFLGRSSVSAGASDPLLIQRTSQGLLRELADESSATPGSIETIYLSTLTRRPDDWERQRMNAVSGSDMLYALLHCNEFVFSH